MRRLPHGCNRRPQHSLVVPLKLCDRAWDHMVLAARVSPDHEPRGPKRERESDRYRVMETDGRGREQDGIQMEAIVFPEEMLVSEGTAQKDLPPNIESKREIIDASESFVNANCHSMKMGQHIKEFLI